MRALLAMGYALQEIERSFQELEEQVRDFPEQLRRERATASAQVEELHSRAVATFADKSVDLDKRMQQEARRADEAESELKAVRDHCSSLESQLQSSSNSVLTLQMQLSKTDGDWRRELDAMQQQLQELASQADTMSGELQAQAARADAATAKWREAEAEVQQCRHSLQRSFHQLEACRCSELQEKLHNLQRDYEACLQELSEQVEYQMNVQEGFLSYIQAGQQLVPFDKPLSGSGISYLGSNVTPCSDRDLADMDEALARILASEKQRQPLSATARMIWLRMCSDSPSPEAAPLSVCVDWLISHDAAGAFGLPVFQRPAVDLALASLSTRLNYEDFLILLERCVAATHSLSNFLVISGPSLVVSRAQFKQSKLHFGLKQLSSDAACDEVFSEIDVRGTGTVAFRQFHEWYQNEKSADIAGDRSKV